MTDWTAGGRIKIERADKHLSDLKAEILAFVEAADYRRVPKEDPETGDILLVAQTSAAPPERWGAIVGDVIHNLRSSLSVLWRATNPSNRRKDDFLIHESSKAFEARFKTKVKGRRQAAMDALKAIKPYKGGNDALWLLHTLDIEDKHRVLIPVVSGVLGISQSEWTFAPQIAGKNVRLGPRLARFTTPVRIYPVEDGTILHRIPADQCGKVDMNPEFLVTIAFGDVPGVQGQPLVETLDALLNTVRNILEQFARIP